MVYLELKLVHAFFEQCDKLWCKQSAQSVISFLSYCQTLPKERTIPWWFVVLLQFFSVSKVSQGVILLLIYRLNQRENSSERKKILQVNLFGDSQIVLL